MVSIECIKCKKSFGYLKLKPVVAWQCRTCGYLMILPAALVKSMRKDYEQKLEKLQAMDFEERRQRNLDRVFSRKTEPVIKVEQEDNDFV